MSDVFLSYKSEDRPRAKIIAEALERYGCSVWLDQKIPPGKTYDEFIKGAIDSAKCVVVLWSKESVKPKEGKWVRTEATIGDRRGILVPVLIDDVEPPIAFMLTEAAKLIDWDGTLPNPEFDLLLNSVGEILGRPIKTKMNVKIDKPEIQRDISRVETEIVTKGRIRDEKSKAPLVGTSFYFILNSILGLIILVLGNFIFNLNIVYTIPTIFISALGGVPGAILVILLHLLGVAF